MPGNVGSSQPKPRAVSTDSVDKSKGRQSPSSPRAHSPLVSRHAMARYDFEIPNMQPIVKKSMSVPNEHVGVIDVSHYMTSESNGEDGEKQRIGEVKLSLAYLEEEEKLKVLLKSVEVFMKPSAVVIGSTWAVETAVTVDLMSDKNKKEIDLNMGNELKLNVKKTEFEDKSLRVNVYDARRRHCNIPVGHAIFALRDLTNPKKLNMFSKKIASYSQPAGFNKGRLQATLMWNVTSQRLEVVIGEVTNLKDPRGSEGKDYFLKFKVYVGNEEYKAIKTPTMKAHPDLHFKEKILINMSSAQLKNCFLVFKLYTKYFNKIRMTQGLIGKTVIGPYMMHAERRLSQWEQMITMPHEEVTETHILYL